MKFFIDTANINEIKEAQQLGILDGVTTNPSLMAKEGIQGDRAIREGISTNCTLVFSAGQALLAAKAGATYVSPFIGRIDDITWDGIALVEEIVELYHIQGFETEVLAASIRSARHIVEAARAGADVVTCRL